MHAPDNPPGSNRKIDAFTPHVARKPPRIPFSYASFLDLGTTNDSDASKYVSRGISVASIGNVDRYPLASSEEVNLNNFF